MFMSEVETSPKGLCLIERSGNGDTSEVVLTPGSAYVVWTNGNHETGQLNDIMGEIRVLQHMVAFFAFFLEDGKTLITPEGWLEKNEKPLGHAYGGQIIVNGHTEDITIYRGGNRENIKALRYRVQHASMQMRLSNLN